MCKLTYYKNITNDPNKITCKICNSILLVKSLKTHYKSKKHILNLNNNIDTYNKICNEYIKSTHRECFTGASLGREAPASI